MCRRLGQRRVSAIERAQVLTHDRNLVDAVSDGTEHGEHERHGDVDEPQRGEIDEATDDPETDEQRYPERDATRP